jgi:hypothetical protein
VQFAFLRPNTVWEDSAVLVRVKDWLWLNQTDAGAPLEDGLVPYGLDLLSSSFDVGASGYPLTYEMPLERKIAIVKNAKTQILESLLQRCQAVGAKYFAPFAGWWRHGLLEHQELASLLDHTSLDNLNDLFKGSSTQLLETIPSAKFFLKEMRVKSDPKVRDRLTAPPKIMALEMPESVLSDDELLSGMKKHLTLLSSMSKSAKSEDVLFDVRIAEASDGVSVRFGAPSENPITLRVTIPKRVAELFLSGDKTVTWNHIDIGYWGVWDRDSDRYPSNFMRILQLGYVSDLDGNGDVAQADEVLGLNIARAIELAPEAVSRVMGRAGLPCVSCQHSLAETIEDAFNIHRVGRVQRDIAISEIGGIVARHKSLSNG